MYKAVKLLVTVELTEEKEVVMLHTLHKQNTQPPLTKKKKKKEKNNPQVRKKKKNKEKANTIKERRRKGEEPKYYKHVLAL